MKTFLLIDNYDSFVFNLKFLFESLPGVKVIVKRNDDPFLAELGSGQYAGLIISPGPGSPDDIRYFGQCMEAITRVCPELELPVLGVCLGFQGIALGFGCRLKRASLPMHGKVSPLRVFQPGVILKGIEDGTKVMRYHSLMIDTDQPMSSDLCLTAEVSADDFSCAHNGRQIMVIEHRLLPIYGVQYHPESFATEMGREMVDNFVSRCSV